ncbi:unnamed protein product, partial [Iphiclides podalirius]
MSVSSAIFRLMSQYRRWREAAAGRMHLHTLMWTQHMHLAPNLLNINVNFSARVSYSLAVALNAERLKLTECKRRGDNWGSGKGGRKKGNAIIVVRPRHAVTDSTAAHEPVASTCYPS